MIAAFDVLYKEGKALVAAVTFESWSSKQCYSRHQKIVDVSADYVPGQFYLRELDPILSVFADLTDIDTILIDGYCYLDEAGKKGLGAYLYDALEAKYKIIGVAKNPYMGSPHAELLHRGESKKPLYITSIGLSQVEASSHIAEMTGNYRMPTLLKEVDSMSRDFRLNE